jgi:hypothetical protein
MTNYNIMDKLSLGDTVTVTHKEYPDLKFSGIIEGLIYPFGIRIKRTDTGSPHYTDVSEFVIEFKTDQYRDVAPSLEDEGNMVMVTTTLERIMDSGSWNKFCEWKGWSPLIVNEGQASEDEIVSLPITKAMDFGLL